MKANRISIIIILLGGLVLATPALAQKKGRGGRGGKLGKGPGAGMGMRGSVKHDLMRYLYPIGLIRHYSSDLELTEEQTAKLRKVVTDVNHEVENLKWDVEKEAQKLTDLVKNEASKDEIYAQMDVIFKYENKIKKKHVGLMVVARDILTKKQRKMLDKVKEEHMERGDWGHGRRRGGRRHRGPDGPPHGPNPGF